MKTLIPLISSLLLSVSIAGIGYFATITYKEVKTRELTDIARYQCSQSSRYQITEDDDTIVWYPVEELYKKCLSEKGVE